MVEINTQKIGRAGELFVQYQFLKFGVDSSLMTTDYGVDLVAFHIGWQDPLLIQVKSTRVKPDADSKWVEWSVRDELKANYVALVDITRDKAWLFAKEEFLKVSSSTGGKGLRLWWYLPEHRPPRATLTRVEDDYRENLVEFAIPKLLGD